MIRWIPKIIFLFGLAAAVWFWNGDIRLTHNEGLIAEADARLGRPRTPVSYAGVARRSTVGAGAPGAGVSPGVGAGARGAGAAPGVGAGAPGAGTQYGNRGGPVNRVGRR